MTGSPLFLLPCTTPTYLAATPPRLLNNCTQQYLCMLGSTVLIPFIGVPAMGGSPVDVANTICTIFFISGIITLLQTLIGDR